MKSVELARELGTDVLLKVEEFAAQRGPLTLSLLRRAVRDSAILEDLVRRPGQYAPVGQRWGLSESHVREIEATAKRLDREM